MTQFIILKLLFHKNYIFIKNKNEGYFKWPLNRYHSFI